MARKKRERQLARDTGEDSGGKRGVGYHPRKRFWDWGGGLKVCVKIFRSLGKGRKKSFIGGLLEILTDRRTKRRRGSRILKKGTSPKNGLQNSILPRGLGSNPPTKKPGFTKRGRHHWSPVWGQGFLKKTPGPLGGLSKKKAVYTKHMPVSGPTPSFRRGDWEGHHEKGEF